MTKRSKSNGHGRPHEREAQPLSERDILNAALRLIDSVGGETFSMRMLATELGVTPMAIYHHVPNKAALVRKLGDLVFEDTPTPTPTGANWRQELKRYSMEGWGRLAVHPGLTDLLLKQPPTQAQRRLIGYGASILIAGGFSPQAASLAITVCSTFMGGVMSMQAQLSRARSRRSGAKRASKPAERDRMNEYLQALDLRDVIEFGIDAIIAGLPPPADARAQPSAKPKPRAPQKAARRGSANRERSL